MKTLEDIAKNFKRLSAWVRCGIFLGALLWNIWFWYILVFFIPTFSLPCALSGVIFGVVFLICAIAQFDFDMYL